MAFSLSSLFSSFSTSGSPDVSAPEATVGIDIASSSVKVVAIEQTPKALMLRSYGELQLGPYADRPIGDTVVLNQQQKTKAILDVLKESQIEVKRGALSMPLSSSFLTVLSIQSEPGEDISNRIPVEAKRFVPLPLSDVTLDWSVLPKLESSEDNVSDIMLAAIENKALTEYKDILGMIGMVGEPAEIEAFSLIRALWKKEDSTLAIVDLGAKTSKLYIVRDENLERLHRVAIGGHIVTNRLAKLLNIPFEDAESMKRSYTRESENARDIYKTMATVMDQPLNEFNQFIKHYESRTGETINRVVFTGGTANSPYLMTFAKDRWSREVELGNPFDKLAYPAFMEGTIDEIAPSFGPSLGAALRQFQYA